jgi:hypothetical protein
MTAKNRQSLLALVGLVVGGAILVWMRSSYQERRHEGDVAQARAVVQGQLDAFKQGDFQRAFSFAASGFHQGMTVADFKKMVEDGYPQIAHPHDFHVGRAQWAGDGAVLVEVVVTGKKGPSIPHIYALARETDGWKVAGVRSSAGPPPPPGFAPGRPPEKRPSHPAATGSV